MTSETVSGTSSAAHTAQTPEATVPSPQRAVARRVEHAVVLRRHQERREQERPDRHDGRDLTGGPDERQAVGGHGPGVGQSGGGQRVGQRQRGDARGGDTRQQRDADEHRPHRGGAGAAHPRGDVVMPISVWRVS